MGSVGSPSPFAAYDSYRDCSRGICSANCRQWCYIIFPPPPFEKDDRTTFSPLIIAIIAILGSAFLLVSYYTIVTRYCRRRRSRRNIEFEAYHDEVTHDQGQVGTTTAGLDETLIKSITVFKYKRGDGLVEGTECSVCLNQFQENESLRLLPKCCHAFHPPCIDPWLKSNSSCPICRADVNPISPILPPPAPSSRTSSTLNISSLEIQRQNDLIFILEDDAERSTHQAELSISPVSDVISSKDPLQVNSDLDNSETRNCIIGDQEEAGQIRRSFSLGRQRNLLAADILRINEDDHEGSNTGICQSGTAIGSSKRIQEGQIKTRRELDLLARGPAAAVKRSVSTERFQFNKAR